jgi:hypothetical protein
MAVQGISWTGVLVRIVIGLAVVFATYNPTGYSFYHWLTAPPPGITALKALAGVVLLIFWLVCLRTAYVSMGMVGMVLGGALLAALVWVLVDAKMLDPGKPHEMTWIVLVILGVLLGVGLGWSLIRARTTGQVEVD